MREAQVLRLLLVAGPEEAEVVAREIGAESATEIARASERNELEAALVTAPHVVVFGGGIPGLSFADAQVMWRSRGYAPSAIVFSRSWNDDEMRAVMAAGAVDYVSNEQRARLPFVIQREARRSLTSGGSKPPSSSVEAATLLQAVVDALPFILFVKDADELRLVVANQTFADMFGKTKEWLLGRVDHEYFPKEQADSFVGIDREVLARRQMKHFEEVARVGGEDRHFKTRKLAIEANGRIYLLGITEDISEQTRAEENLRNSQRELEEANRRLEENLVELKKSRGVSARVLASYQQRALQMEIIRQQNEDLDRLARDLAKSKRLEEQKSREIEQAARLKSEFLANFSHEIRTPLNGIIGYCDLLAREEGSRLTPHGRRDLQVVKANAKTLLALINDILDLSKIEAGHIEIVRETVDTAALVDECVATVREYLKGRDVDV
ncbi:MAG TPA: histidine kinase dimerization/phospho-acceptor domain-containing protein, partial [Labilithrix sp.]|nr:histidine kinase dimerization/phospho-acceptor domain-containing protein [Labilithrix sp.]